MSLDDVKRLRTQFLDVIDGAIANLENGVEIGNETKKSIVVLEDGRVYVKAARKVITATDLSGQRSQITSFFNELLKDNNVLPIPTIDGNTLYITKNETAFKARDNYVSVNGQRIKLRDNDFLAKMNAEAHVDELAEISLPQNSNDRKDNKNHKFTKGGFTYRTAYFEDFDGKYYQVTLSIGKGNIATVYNVVLKEKGNAPVRNIISAIGSKTVGAFPNNSVPQNTEKSNIKKSLDVDSEGTTLSKEQIRRYKNVAPELRDEQGRIKPFYHGTSRADVVMRSGEVADPI